MLKGFFRLLTELSSRKFISNLFGKIAKTKWSRKWIPLYAKLYDIPIEQAEKAVEEYVSLNDFFTRRLKDGLRPIDFLPNVVTSPVDALITGMGNIQEGTIVNVKGQDYTIKELLNASPRTVNYQFGQYIILYLSPKDYHRIHAPIDGKIVEKEYLKGKYYPVNDFGLRHMPRVLSRNERKITYIQHLYGEMAMVKVGAMNVSSIQYVESATDQLVKGQEIAFFEFGSTVILLMEKDTFQFQNNLKTGISVKMGEALGHIQNQ